MRIKPGLSTNQKYCLARWLAECYQIGKYILVAIVAGMSGYLAGQDQVSCIISSNIPVDGGAPVVVQVIDGDVWGIAVVGIVAFIILCVWHAFIWYSRYRFSQRMILEP